VSLLLAFLATIAFNFRLHWLKNKSFKSLKASYLATEHRIQWQA